MAAANDLRLWLSSSLAEGRVVERISFAGPRHGVTVIGQVKKLHGCTAGAYDTGPVLPGCPSWQPMQPASLRLLMRVLHEYATGHAAGEPSETGRKRRLAVCLARMATRDSHARELWEVFGEVLGGWGEGFSSLHELDVGGNPPYHSLEAQERFAHAAAGADVHLAKLSARRGPAVLDLRDNLFGDRGATALGNALRTNRSVESLKLSGNGIGHAGLKALRGCLYGNKKLLDVDIDEVVNSLMETTVRKHRESVFIAEAARMTIHDSYAGCAHSTAGSIPAKLSGQAGRWCMCMHFETSVACVRGAGTEVQASTSLSRSAGLRISKERVRHSGRARSSGKDRWRPLRRSRRH